MVLICAISGVLAQDATETMLRGARTLGIVALAAIVAGIWWIRRNA